MSMTKLQLVWPEKNNFNQILFENFRFANYFDLTDGDVYCGKLEPAELLQYNGQPLKVVHFKNFVLDDHFMYFNSPNDDMIKILFPENKGIIKLTIVPPEPVPVPDSWNKSLTSSNDNCIAHVFYYPQEGDRNLKFMKTLKCPWSSMATQISGVLAENQRGHYGKSVGILTETGKIPELNFLDSFFSSYTNGKLFMIIVASSYKEFTLIMGNLVISTKNVPRIPKDIIHRCRLEASAKGYHKHLRRVIKIAVNGGVPVDLLEQALIKKNNGTLFKCSDFDRIFLLFGTAPNIPVDLKRRLKGIFEDSMDHLRISSSEIALRTIFWDSLIREMLRTGLENQPNKPFLFEPEWNSTRLFPEFNLRKVDIAILFNMQNQDVEYPIALFEEAKDDFDAENPHKDFTKLAAMLSSSCLKLAHDMAKIRKKPEEARALGALIGRGKIQFIIAHPIITEIRIGESTLNEIHCNISSSSHCIYDVASATDPSDTSEVSENDFCCQVARFKKGQFEKVVHGEIDLKNYEFVPEELKRSVEDIVLPIKEAEIEQERIFDIERLFPEGFNHETMNKIYFFICCIKERLSFIKSDASNMDTNDHREFFEPGKFGEFGSGRRSHFENSPVKITASRAMSESQQVSKRLNYGSSLNAKRKSFKIEKDSVHELNITRNLSDIFPLSFPILFNHEIEGDKVVYYLEYLERLLENDWGISRLIVCPTAEESLFKCFCFAVQCLFALDNLHSHAGLVHSDISPWNIMYSETTKTWKLIDFGQSLLLSESLITKRDAGTEGFIAPESKETGIFTEKSDIYSLGKVFLDVIDPIFLHQIHIVESDDEDERTIAEIRSIEPVAMKFTNLMNKMTQTDPSARPSALDALKTIFELFESTYIVPDETIYDLIDFRLISKQNYQEEEEENQPKTREQEEISEKDVVNPITAQLSPSKRPRIVEEKEPSTTITPQVQ